MNEPVGDGLGERFVARVEPLRLNDPKGEYANLIERGTAGDRDEIRVARIATLGIGVVAIGLGIAFERQNIAYMVGLAHAISASSNLPALILALYWPGLTTRGAVAGGWVGLVGAPALTVLVPRSG